MFGDTLHPKCKGSRNGRTGFSRGMKSLRYMIGLRNMMLLAEPAELPVSAVRARTRFFGCVVMRTRVRTRVNMHNPRTWYAPKRQICRFSQEWVQILQAKGKGKGGGKEKGGGGGKKKGGGAAWKPGVALHPLPRSC